MNLFKVEELNKRAEELIDEFGDIDDYDEFCDKCGRSAITFGLFDYLEKEFKNPYDKEKEPNMFWRFEEIGRWINFFKKIWKYMKKGETNMKPLKEEVETKAFSDKELFDDFKDSIGGRCFNKDSVYRWIYKLTDIKPTTEEVYKIMDGWVKSKWAYKKQNEQTGADFYYFDLKETVNERRKNMNNSKLLKEEEYYGDDKYANVNIVNKDPNSTPYMLYIWCGRGYMLDRFLCFADYEEDAIDMTLEWLWDKGNYDMVYDYDKVKKWAEEFAIDDDEEMQDMKERMEELEKVYDKYQDNIGDTIDNNWSDYRNIEKEYENIKDEYEEMLNERIDNFISEEFVNDSNYQLFCNSENFEIEELDMDTAKEVIYQSEYVDGMYGQDIPTFEEVEGTLFNESKRNMKRAGESKLMKESESDEDYRERTFRNNLQYIYDFASMAEEKLPKVIEYLGRSAVNYRNYSEDVYDEEFVKLNKRIWDLYMRLRKESRELYNINVDMDKYISKFE